jgi:hypothetical protein
MLPEGKLFQWDPVSLHSATSGKCSGFPIISTERFITGTPHDLLGLNQSGEALKIRSGYPTHSTAICPDSVHIRGRRAICSDTVRFSYHLRFKIYLLVSNTSILFALYV